MAELREAPGRGQQGTRTLSPTAGEELRPGNTTWTRTLPRSGLEILQAQPPPQPGRDLGAEGPAQPGPDF